MDSNFINFDKPHTKKQLTLKGKNRESRDRDENETDKLQVAKASGFMRKIKTSYNQTTFDLIKKGNGSFIFTSLYAMEKQGLSKSTIKLKFQRPIKSNLALLTIGSIVGLVATPISYIEPLWNDGDLYRKAFWKFYFTRKLKVGYLNYFQVSKLSLNRQNHFYKNTFSSYEHTKAELKFLELNTDSSLCIVKDAAQLDSFIKRKNEGMDIPTLIFLTYEGGHNFYGASNKKIEDVMDETCNDMTCKKEIYENIRNAKNGKYRVFMIGVAHLFFSKLSGGSRGLDIDRPGVLRNILNTVANTKHFEAIDKKPDEGLYTNVRERVEYKPKQIVPCTQEYINKNKTNNQNGFGLAIIDSILDNNNKFRKRTFIDMRHMDILARNQLIEHIEKKYWAEKKDTVPLVVSHAAYSGENYRIGKETGTFPNFDLYSEFKDYKTFFTERMQNCASFQTNTGITSAQSLNAHIDSAGWFHSMSTNLYTEEIEAIYKSKGMIGISFEERALGTTAFNYEKNKFTKDKLKGFLKSNESRFNYSKNERDSLINAEPFVRNIFAMIKHSGLPVGDINTWKHICLGTDFDGVINPIDICPTAKEIPNFYHFLCRNLDFYIDYLGYEPMIKCGKSSIEIMNMLFYKNL